MLIDVVSFFVLKIMSGIKRVDRRKPTTRYVGGCMPCEYVKIYLDILTTKVSYIIKYIGDSFLRKMCQLSVSHLIRIT